MIMADYNTNLEGAFFFMVIGVIGLTLIGIYIIVKIMIYIRKSSKSKTEAIEK